MEKIYFTLDEANEMLPYIQMTLKELRELKREIAEKIVEMENRGVDLQKITQTENLSESEKKDLTELQMLADQVQDRVYEMTGQGILLKDIEKGLVDFYCQMPGEEVFLCWQEGESEIQFFHSIEAGFSGRRSLYERSILQNITQVH